MDLNILRFRFLCDKDIGKKNGEGEENNDDNHALLQPTLGFAHPGNALILSFLRAHRGATMVMVVRHCKLKVEK